MRRLALLIILAAVLLGMFALPGAAFGEGYIFDSTYGGPGTAIGQFNAPGALAFANGELFIGDTSNNRVQVFTRDGAFVRSWSGANSSTGICVDRARGLVYVSEYFAGDVKVFDRGGNLVRTIGSSGSGDGQLSQPYQIALDSSGNVYVADRGNSRINVFTLAGAPLRRWGSAGTAAGQFSGVTGIAIDASDNVYTFEQDAAARRVQKFDTVGTPLAQWGSAGSDDVQFGVSDYFLALAPDGNIFVADSGNDAVKEFKPSGVWVRTITHDNLDNPVGIAFAGDRTLFTSSITSHTISTFTWDDTAPVITHDYDGEWHSQPFSVTFSAVDDFTAVPWLRWSPTYTDWTNDGVIPVAASASHANDGVMTIHIGAGDSVSNWAYKTLKIKVDTRAPISTVSGVPASWTNQEVYAHIAATDIGAGVNRTFYDLDGAGLTELPDTGIVPVTTPGQHTLQYWSQDNCADTPNQETAKSVQVYIDMMGPDAIPMNNVAVVRGRPAIFKYQLNDDYSATCTVKLVIKKKSKTVKTVNLGVKDSAFMVPAHAYSKKMAVKLAAGKYTWTVVATDLAGNVGSYAPKKLTVK